MKLDAFVGRTQNLWAENRVLKLFCVLNFFGLMGLGVLVYAAVHYKTVVLIPPDLTEEVEIHNGMPNTGYIEKVVRDVAYLSLNYSPVTARAQFGTLLTYYAPEDFPEATSYWELQADRAEDMKIGSTFSIVKVEVDAKGKRVYLTGAHILYSMDQILERRDKTFTVHYDVRRGRFSIVAMEEGRK